MVLLAGCVNISKMIEINSSNRPSTKHRKNPLFLIRCQQRLIVYMENTHFSALRFRHIPKGRNFRTFAGVCQFFLLCIRKRYHERKENKSMDLLMTYTDSIHITETDKGIEIVIDKPSEIYDWLQEIKAYYETDLFSVLYDLIRTERENERDEL